jgi:hypothetical protein
VWLTPPVRVLPSERVAALLLVAADVVRYPILERLEPLEQLLGRDLTLWLAATD